MKVKAITWFLFMIKKKLRAITIKIKIKKMSQSVKFTKYRII